MAAFRLSSRRQASVEGRRRFLWRVFAAAVILLLLVLLRVFYTRNTEFKPSRGGTYIEGSVGQLHPLNPWFIIQNDVNRDIASLVFGGLLRYDPTTQSIVEDLATLKVSDDNRFYTLTLRDGLQWHDSTVESPHPVTVDDVMFTFQMIQDPAFSNTLLRQNFQGVTIEAIDDRTVRFRLEESYRFFSSNLTLGLVPKRSFEGVPVDRLDQALDFGFQPVGAGPYAVKGIVQTELSTEVTLERFERETVPPPYHLDRVIFRIFPDYQTLLSDLRNLHGVRLVPRNDDGEPLVPNRFRAIDYKLPQYVALFLNTSRPALQDQQLRLGLQLGTDKQAIADATHEQFIVDTPLLELSEDDWRFQFDPDAAQGALFVSQWHLPEKVRLQRLLEQVEANRTGALRLPPVALLEDGAALTVTGTLLELGTGGTLNGLPVQVQPTDSGAWIVQLPTLNTGAIIPGVNLLTLRKLNGDPVDSFYVTRATNTQLFDRANREQELLQLFLASRDGTIPGAERITVSDLFLEDDTLRIRTEADPVDIRVNDRGERLTLRLLTSASPPQYAEIATLVREQWAQLGVAVEIDIPRSREDFEEKLLSRDYDVLLFGQSLLDNLDSYPYWHSSGVQKVTDDRSELLLDAYNLSQYSSLQADRLLEFIRQEADPEERTESLQELRETLSNDVPAIFLYAPLYTFAVHQKLQGVELAHFSLHSDRFLTLHNWYMDEERVFKTGVSWWSFIPWLLRLRSY